MRPGDNVKPADKIIPSCLSCLLWLIFTVMPVTSVALDTFADTVSYFGGAGDERTTAVASDDLGNIYITGSTTSTGLPGLVSGQSGINGAQDAFVSMLAPDGTVVFSRYIGVANAISIFEEQEQGRAIAVADDGAIYVAGSVVSVSGFAGVQTTAGAYGGCDNGNIDGFLAVLGADGALRYLTCFGGGAADYVTAMTLNSDGSVTLVGYTHSDDFPLTSLAFQGLKGDAYDASTDAFVVRISPQGMGADDLLFSSYLGGAGGDRALAMTDDALGNLYITGSSSSGSLASAVSSDTDSLSDNIFVTKLAPDGVAYLGPAYVRSLPGIDLSYGGCTMGTGIAVDQLPGGANSQRLFITGRQERDDGSGGQYSQAVIASLDVSGDGTWNLQTLSGSQDQSGCGATIGHGIVLDGNGGGLVTGVTMSADLPAADVTGPGAYHGGEEGFVTRFDADMSLLYTHYLGGSGDDAGYAIDRSATGPVRVAGSTASDDIQDTNGTPAGGVDVLSLALNADADLVVSVADQGPALFDEPMDFDLLLANDGPDSSEAVVFELVLPSDFPGNVSLPLSSCAPVATGWICPLGTLPSGTQVTLPVQLSSPQVGNWSLSYSLLGSAYEPHPENDRGQFDVELSSVLPLQIVDGSKGAGISGSGALDVYCLYLLMAIFSYRNLRYPVQTV